MRTMEYVNERLAKMGTIDTFGTKKEIKALPEILGDREHLIYVTSGFLDNNTWLIACTDKRIIFLDKGMIWGMKQKEIPLERINSIEHSKGLVLGEISVWDGASKITIKNISKQSIEPMIRKINKAMDRLKNKSNVSNNIGSTVAEQLEKLFNLKQQGIITEEEFSIQKSRILNM